MGGRIQRKGEAIGVKQLFEPESSTFTYLLWDQTTKDAVIIDPVDVMVDRDIKEAKDLGLNLVYGGKSTTCLLFRAPPPAMSTLSVHTSILIFISS